MRGSRLRAVCSTPARTHPEAARGNKVAGRKSSESGRAAGHRQGAVSRIGGSLPHPEGNRAVLGLRKLGLLE